MHRTVHPSKATYRAPEPCIRVVSVFFVSPPIRSTRPRHPTPSRPRDDAPGSRTDIASLGSPTPVAVRVGRRAGRGWRDTMTALPGAAFLLIVATAGATAGIRLVRARRTAEVRRDDEHVTHDRRRDPVSGAGGPPCRAATWGRPWWPTVGAVTSDERPGTPVRLPAIQTQGPRPRVARLRASVSRLGFRR